VLLACAALFATSALLPYSSLRFPGPPPTNKLELVFYLGHVEGPVADVLQNAHRLDDGSLRGLSQLERSLPIAGATVICLLLLAATLVRNRWAALLALPSLAFPWVVLADMRRWMRPVVRDSIVDTSPGSGLLLAAAASVAVLVGLWLHRRAYKDDKPRKA
jgi:hypothetical protein